MKKYLWDKRTYGVKPEIVGGVFEELEKKYGSVTPENFLEASMSSDSPTHKLFEWDDAKAASIYRRNQAQQIILSLRVEIVPDNVPRKVPAFVNVVSGDRSSYQNITRAFEVKETREIVLQRAYNEMATFRAKYEMLNELAAVMTEIGKVLDNVG